MRILSMLAVVGLMFAASASATVPADAMPAATNLQTDAPAPLAEKVWYRRGYGGGYGYGYGYGYYQPRYYGWNYRPRYNYYYPRPSYGYYNYGYYGRPYYYRRHYREYY